MIIIPIKPNLARVSLFFKKEELLKKFKVEMETDFYGMMKTSPTNSIPFGISPKGYITCIITDLNGLPLDILNLFLENLSAPDRIGKHYQMYLDGNAWDIKENDPN